MKSKLGRIVYALVVPVVLVGCSTQDTGSSAEQDSGTEFQFELAKVHVDGEMATFDISTNLPLPIEIMAGLSLADQKPKDVYIGVSEKRTINKPNSVVSLYLANANDPLPDGDYLAQIDFYPAWGAISSGSKIAPELHDSQPVLLSGNGIETKQANRRNELQRWVFLNVDVNTPWDEAVMIRNLGQYEKSPADLSPMHDGLYFPNADMTMIVNRRSGELSLWRVGRQSK